MVADEVTVSTKKEGSDIGYIWRWNGLVVFSLFLLLSYCGLLLHDI